MKQLVLGILLLLTNMLSAQKVFTHADSLRGSLTPVRTCYDVNYYDLNVKVDIDKKLIIGSNMIRFRVVDDMERMQVDLHEEMQVAGIYHGNEQLNYTRDGNAMFINFLKTLKKGTLDSIVIKFAGIPIEAKRAPWDGGFVWKKDSLGNPWVGVACEGIGASSWWPNKDHLSDKCDSMRLKVAVPLGLMDVSNGKLIKSYDSEGWSYTEWFISYPINNYNVTLNIAKYAHLHDFYLSGKDTLALDYYVLPYNLDKAKQQFQQVKPMLKCYERYFGRYPFWRDGYKLVETHYLGMEHQGAIAYGNGYKTGYAGRDYSGIGLDFDYIIIHESGHEWWGNNVCCEDLADMWIHEGFCTYGEAVYVECMFDSITAQQYVNAKKSHIANKQPIIGQYGVNEEGSGDMYPKGMLLLNTLRFVINNDSVWWGIIKGIQHDFALKTVTTGEIEQYISSKAHINLTPIFDQYLRQSALPVFEYELKPASKGKLQLSYHWLADVKAFDLPIRVKTSKKKYVTLHPHTGEMQIHMLDLRNADDFKIDTDHAYIDVKELSTLEK